MTVRRAVDLTIVTTTLSWAPHVDALGWNFLVDTLPHHDNVSLIEGDYYGKTFGHFTFLLELQQHMGISNLTEKRLKSVKQSAVSDHLLECNRWWDFDHFDILVSYVNKFRKFRILRKIYCLNETNPS